MSLLIQCGQFTVWCYTYYCLRNIINLSGGALIAFIPSPGRHRGKLWHLPRALQQVICAKTILILCDSRGIKIPLWNSRSNKARGMVWNCLSIFLHDTQNTRARHTQISAARVRRWQLRPEVKEWEAAVVLGGHEAGLEAEVRQVTALLLGLQHRTVCIQERSASWWKIEFQTFAFPTASWNHPRHCRQMAINKIFRQCLLKIQTHKSHSSGWAGVREGLASI